MNLVALVTKPESNPIIPTALTNLNTAVAAAQAAHAGQFQTEFDDCRDAINEALSRARRAAQTKGEQQYGFVVALLSDDEDLLGEVIRACVETLNGPDALRGNPSISSAGSVVDQQRKSMETEFSQIDQQAAERKAKADMAFTRRTLATLLDDLNIFSISPVLVFDIAGLGPKKSGLGGVRYGPGAGVRFEAASTANFTTGYAFNVRPGPGEGKGAFFFSIGLRDLFH